MIHRYYIQVKFAGQGHALKFKVTEAKCFWLRVKERDWEKQIWQRE